MGYSSLSPTTKFSWSRSLSNAVPYHTVDYDFDNLVEMQIKSCNIHKDEQFIGTLTNGRFEYLTFAEFGQQVDKFRGVLAVHNIGVDDKVLYEI